MLMSILTTATTLPSSAELLHIIQLYLCDLEPRYQRKDTSSHSSSLCHILYTIVNVFANFLSYYLYVECNYPYLCCYRILDSRISSIYAYAGEVARSLICTHELFSIAIWSYMSIVFPLFHFVAKHNTSWLIRHFVDKMH